MLLLVPVGLYRLNWFFPALMILVGAHYLPFATLYGMHTFLFLSGILIASGVVIARCFSGTRSLGAWVAGLVLFRLRLDRALHRDRRAFQSLILIRLMARWDKSNYPGGDS